MKTAEYQSKLIEHAATRGYGKPKKEGNQWIFRHPTSKAEATVEYVPELSDKKGYLTYAKGILTSAHNAAVERIKSEAPFIAKKSTQKGGADFASSLDIQLAHELLEMVSDLNHKKKLPAIKFDNDLADLDSLASSLKCANCGELVEKPSPYCGEYCQQFAGTIRYSRKAIQARRTDDEDFHIGLGTRLIALLKGGYPTKARSLDKETRDFVFGRDKMICQICGGTADQIDHINGSSSAITNLRAVCGKCNRKLAVDNVSFVNIEENANSGNCTHETLQELAVRIAAPNNQFFCDDYNVWKSAEPFIRSSREKLLK
jgi:hypothetical protein